MDQDQSENKFHIERRDGFQIYVFKYDSQDAQPLRIVIENIRKARTNSFGMNKLQIQELYLKHIKSSNFQVNRLKDYFYNWNCFEIFDLVNKSDMLIKDTNIKIPTTVKELEKYENLQLKNWEKQAFVALKVIHFIANIKVEKFFQQNINLSIRERLITFIGLLQIQCKKQVKELFQISIDVNSNTNVIYQQNSSVVSNQKKITFNPTFLTAQIFHYLTQNYRINKFIYGFGGIGKSLSLRLFACLSKSIEICKRRRNEQLNEIYSISLKKVRSCLQESEFREFEQFPKVYYITLSKQDCIDEIIKSIRLQSYTYKTQDKNFLGDCENIEKIIQQIKDYYVNKLNMKVMFIVDQINIYTSLIRQVIIKKQQQTMQTVKHITKFLNRLKEKGFHIIYSSSINCQQKLVEIPLDFSVHRFLYYDNNVQKKIVGSYKQKQSYCKESYLEIIHSIFFQLQIRLTGLGLFQELKIYQKKFNQYFQYLSSKYFSNEDLRITQNIMQVVPLAIHNYFNKHLRQLQLELCEGEELFQKMRQLQDNIKDKERKRIAKGYQRFIQNEQSKQIKFLKYKLFVQIAAFAKFIVGQIGTTFKFYWHQWNDSVIKDFDRINKSHAFLDYQKKKIQIFYSPRVFLQIIKNVSQPRYSIAKLLEQYQDLLTENEDLFDYLVGKQYTYLVSHRQITLKFGLQTLYVNGQEDYLLIFDDQNQVQLTLATSLYKIIQKLQNTQANKQEVKNEIIEVQPVKIAKQKVKTLSYYYNRMNVDSLVISKICNHPTFKYKLRTFDFTTNFSSSIIMGKYQQTYIFFQKMKQHKNSQDKDDFEEFEMVHYIVAPDKIIEEIKKQFKDEIDQNFRIVFTAIEQFDIKINNQQQNSVFDTNELTFIKEKLFQRQKYFKDRRR